MSKIFLTLLTYRVKFLQHEHFLVLSFVYDYYQEGNFDGEID